MWFVYLAQGRSGAVYCGISTDVARRISEHNTSKRGAKWARGERPLVLLWSMVVGTRGEASKIESRIKRLSRLWKLAIVNIGWRQVCAARARRPGRAARHLGTRAVAVDGR